jgi:hypothetical protein
MIVVDRLLIGGLRFVLDKVATAVDAELNDDTALREELLELQMRHELGEIGDQELAARERELLERMRALRPQAETGGAISFGGGGGGGVEIDVGFSAEDADAGPEGSDDG